MKNIALSSTSSTPSILFTPSEGKLEIRGRSIPENSIEFYKELLDYIDEYIDNPHKTTEVIIQLEYYNSSSAVCILNLLRKIKQLFKKSHQVSIEWLYEEDDEDTYNAGKNFQGVLEIPIKLIKI